MALGLHTAQHVIKVGREAFFGSATADLPISRSDLLRADDLTPQFGYVGERYPEKKVLLIGINPGNGSKNDARTVGDARMMPALRQFAQSPTSERFQQASDAYLQECRHWPVWKRHCSEVLGAGKLTLDNVAYTNCLPWRTASQSAFADAVAERAVHLYLQPLLEELRPRVVVAMGKRAFSILQQTSYAGHLIAWNRAQAATLAVRAERSRTADDILRIVSASAH